jgi:hypothetical protein
MLFQIYRLISTFLFDPIQLFYKWKAIPSYIRNYIEYSKLNKGNKSFKIYFKDLYFTTNDKFLNSGTAVGHYFHQDLWAAKSIFKTKVNLHVDIASRIDGFVAHLLTFCEVQYVDIRPLDGEVEGLKHVKGSITELPFESNSISSLSCLHVIEHIGLGRYGDPINPNGYKDGIVELCRVLAPKGLLYFGTPVGKEKLAFDAHRVFNARKIHDIFNEYGLTLKEFNLIDDRGLCIQFNADFTEADRCNYGCGLFVFEKK